jgi:hypothetical protein
MSFEGFSMTTRLTFPASMFSVVCQRCGSTLRKSADSCPNCGADRAAAFGEGHAKTRGAERENERGGMFKPAGAAAAGAAAGPALAAAAPVAGAVPPSVARTPEPIAPASPPPSVAASGTAAKAAPPLSLEADPDVLPDSEGWNRRKTVIASVCALALLAGGTAYMLHDGSADDEDAPPTTQHSASGAIDARPGGRAQGSALPATPTAPAVSAATEKRPSADDRPMSIGDTVLAARRAMEQHDLTAARNRLKSIAPAQQTRPDVQRLKDDLAQRELERDAALQLARACEKTSAWACVQQNAGEALALDGSNTESQAMLERVITHAGWLAGTPPIAAKKKAAPDGAGAVPPAATAATVPPATAAVQPATPPANVAAAKPAPAVAPAPAQTQTPPPATQKQAVAAARTPAAPPAETRATSTETHATTTPPPARESRRSASYGRSAPSSAMADVTVIPAPAISPPLLPTTPATSTTAATRGAAPVTAAPPSAARGTATTVTTMAPAAAEHATPATTAATTATTHSTAPTTAATTTTTSTTTSTAPTYAAPAPAPAARVATVIPSTAAAVTTNAPANTMTTTAPAPAPIPATATRTAAVTGNTPGSTGATETRPAPRAPLPDGENADELERAIKQFGWSGGDSMPKPSR